MFLKQANHPEGKDFTEFTCHSSGCPQVRIKLYLSEELSQSL